MRHVWTLTLAQALAACGTIMLVTFGGIVGARLAPSPALATLPGLTLEAVSARTQPLADEAAVALGAALLLLGALKQGQTPIDTAEPC